jgi:site-specific DNA-methyltransferase (adenine-specific)
MIHTTQTWKIGDCIELMQECPDNHFDLVSTDPPYGYSFMGKDWDKAVPTVDIWQECLRILKPGAFAFIMSAPRQDVLAHNLVNLSDAGFETGFTSIYWAFASGFPKAGNIGKLVDKRLGAERDIVGVQRLTGNAGTPTKLKGGTYSAGLCINRTGVKIDITAATSPQAKALDGSYAGFQPKPAVEVIMVVMKPLSEKTYVDQALANGKGITWLDRAKVILNHRAITMLVIPITNSVWRRWIHIRTRWGDSQQTFS